MSYYSDYEEEPNAGNSESKWEPTADMNIIKSVMSAVTETMKARDHIGKILSVNFKKLGDGQNMSARMEISTNLWTIVWENTDSEDLKNSNFVFYPTSENKEIEQSRVLSINTEELVKLFSPDGRI